MTAYPTRPARSQFPLTRRLGWLTVSPATDLLHQCFMILPIKGHGAMHQDVQENTQRPAVHLGGGRKGEMLKQRHSMCCRRESFCPSVSNTTEDMKVSSEGFLLPSLVTRGEVGGVAEGSGAHRKRCCQSLPPGKDSHKHRNSGQATAILLGQRWGGWR